MLNPNIKLDNLKQERYREALSPEIAEYVDITDQTLKRNNSLLKFGELLRQCSQVV